MLKSLLSLGKIEKTDWNVKEIEKKMEENRMGRGTSRQKAEKVPKWSKEQFEDKVGPLVFYSYEKIISVFLN
jgi:hypothetical protein